MNDIISIVSAVLSLISVICIILLLRRSSADFSPLQNRFDALDTAQDRSVTSVREESARSRTEATETSRQLRGELTSNVQTLQQTLLSTLTDLGGQQHTALDRFAIQIKGITDAAHENGRSLREEITRSLTQVGEHTAGQVKLSAEAQQKALENFSGQLARLADANTLSGRSLREEIITSLNTVSGQMIIQAKQDAEAQRTGLEGFAGRLDSLSKTLESRINTLLEGTAKALLQIRDEGRTSTTATRTEITMALKAYQETVQVQLADNVTQVRTQMSLVAENTEKRLEALRATVEQRLQSLQADNAVKLEQMRHTVDEKLQGTLERRLGESFKLVSERLELVHKGLGEMQTLASGVGDLKKVLTNVKTRGTWGEVQLGNLLDQMLTSDQYQKNVATVPGSSERVEFAIKLPGRGGDIHQPVWVPIDSKCPIEDYQRLVDAAERGDADAVRESSRQLDIRIKACAKDIFQKYISAPHTTDFAILFVPTEGLFAEVLRMPGLTDFLQREFRVMVAGPTTLSALLSSLQMGFRTLAIEKRSSEVWSILSAVKTEFGKFGAVMDRVKKQLGAASNTIEDATVRTRAMERELGKLDKLPVPVDAAMLVIPALAVTTGDADVIT